MAITFYKTLPESQVSHGLYYPMDTLVLDPKEFRPDVDCDHGIHGVGGSAALPDGQVFLCSREDA